MHSYANVPVGQKTGVNVQQRPNVQGGMFTPALNQTNLDTVTIRDKKEIYLEKLDKLFPNGGVEQAYKDICRDFGIIDPPHLEFCGSKDNAVGGGYTFNKNEISISIEDLMESDTKIVGIKNGKREILTSPKVKLPLFIDKKNAQLFLYAQSKNGNMGYDKLVAEPLTPDEQRKFVIQKLAHEVIHAQQHQIMQQTEGIDSKDIFRAWTHYKPKNLIDKYVFDFQTDRAFKMIYWGDKPEREKIYSQDSKEGQLAKVWLEAVRNYPPVTSPEYEQNAIEKDAYERSAQYTADKYGSW